MTTGHQLKKLESSHMWEQNAVKELKLNIKVPILFPLAIGMLVPDFSIL